LTLIHDSPAFKDERLYHITSEKSDRLLGHKDMGTTQWYTHVLRGHLGVAVDVTSAGLSGALTTKNQSGREKVGC